MTYKDTDEWLAANPVFQWRATQTSEDEVPVPMQVVADATSTSRTTVMFWEQGKFMPKYQYLVKLAALLQYENSDTLYNEWQNWLEARPAGAPTPVGV